MSSFPECLVCHCVFCLFTPFLSVFFKFHRKKLVLLNLIKRYVTSISEQFLKSKDIMELCKVNSFNVIQIAPVSTKQVVLIYIRMSIGPYVCCVLLCVISNQSTSKKLHHVSDLSKLNALLHKTHSNVLLVLWYQGLTYVDP